jgi:mannose-6-phosphate isomerase-like protein (cupin superfamily)
MNSLSNKLNLYHEDRPWGSFDQYTHNQKSTLKIITVNKGQATSLQYHHHRSEYWVVVSGSGKLHIGEDVFDSEVGKMYEVPLGAKHRIEGSSDQSLTIMEISLGDFDEGDIVRLEDAYGRVNQAVNS